MRAAPVFTVTLLILSLTFVLLVYDPISVAIGIIGGLGLYLHALQRAMSQPR